jgi:hypothetical protein
MGKGLALCCACGVWCCIASAAFADTVYTNQADWLAAVSALGPVTDLSLSPVASVPYTGGVYVDDEGTLSFPDNHGAISVYANGWQGDVHHTPPSPFDHEPDENHFTFNRAVVAFAATAWVGQDLGPDVDSVLLSFGGAQHRLSYLDYSPRTPGFFGWVGDAPASGLTVTSDAGSHFYQLSGVQYVTVPPPAAAGTAAAVPLPRAAWGGLALLAVAAVARVRQAGWRVRGT